VRPHGGRLINRFVSSHEGADLLARAAELPRIALDERAAADAELIATGTLSPLSGFVRKAEYLSVIQDMRLPGGLVFSMLERKDELGVGGRITLARRTIARQFPQYHRDPREVRALIAERGWRRTVAFQTRNPVLKRQP